MTPLFQAVNLTKRFGGLTAVDNASLDVSVGEVIGLVGDNGAGKSTFIKMIAGVYEPDEGDLFFEGRKVPFAGPRATRDLGIETIYQDLALAENLDVGSNIFDNENESGGYFDKMFACTFSLFQPCVRR